MAKLLFFSIFLLIVSETFACEPDSTARLIADRLQQHNEITIESDVMTPALYNIDMSDMWGFNKDRFKTAYLVQQPGTHRIYFWETNGAGCRWIDVEFETKFVLYQILNKPLIRNNTFLLRKTYNIK